MKGKIYIIRSHQTDDVYYGSTIENYLSARMGGHRCDYKRYVNGKRNYVSSFEIMKYEDAYIELVEEVDFETKEELYAREGYYIRNNTCVNKTIPDRTDKEYRETNKEKKKEIDKKYYEENKEKHNEQMKKWYEANKEQSKEYQKEWYEANKEKRKEQSKEWYEANKEKRKEQMKKYREKKKLTRASLKPSNQQTPL